MTDADDKLTFWVIYKNPKDHPGKYVLRRQHAMAGVVEIERQAMVADSAKELRRHLPPGLVNIRHPADEPTIFEVWV